MKKVLKHNPCLALPLLNNQEKNVYKYFVRFAELRFCGHDLDTYIVQFKMSQYGKTTPITTSNCHKSKYSVKIMTLMLLFFKPFCDLSNYKYLNGLQWSDELIVP